MSKAFVFCIFLTSFFIDSVYAQKDAPKPYGPVPSANQWRWQKMEYYAFLHFSINTFTDQEWGSGAEDPKIFNPDSLDCRQWARVCKEAGMKGIILTVKHHSGFCLWPSKYTEFSVRNCPWKNGKGDIVRELADACREYGLKLGVYLSPWDRNSGEYGKPGYITYFRNQLRELLTNYGDIFEVWFDGANGGSGYYGGANETRKIDRRTYYDWKNTYKLIRQLQPKIVIWNDGGDRGDLRWVGTEDGYVGETNWSLLNATGDVPGDMLAHGLENGDSWVPGEVNTSIRPGWFYHAYEDSRVKSLPKLLDVYYSSFGRNATMLLNFPIDRHGLIHPNDEKAALQLAAAVKEVFADNLAAGVAVTATNVRRSRKCFGAAMTTDGNEDTYWTTDDGLTKAALTVDFGKPTFFNRFLAQEYIRLGQRVKAFTVEALVNGQWRMLARETTIGYKRILRFPGVTATQLRFTITDAKACPVIAAIRVYNAPPVLSAPVITRDRQGMVGIHAADSGTVVHYTLDGSIPGSGSPKYTGSLASDGKLTVQAIAIDPATGKSSQVGREAFDISHRGWHIVGTRDPEAEKVIDGDTHTAWRQGMEENGPTDLVIDLGVEYTLKGFRYLPDQYRRSGLITTYRFYVSADNHEWALVDEGEFGNISNNPLWQVKSFPAVHGRYIRLRAIGSTGGSAEAGYAEVDVVTD
ncbi:MAG: alpha-L-fucosidase [Puia sp.]|nr:alpha-L-fucosidase [Puia sp.]